MEKENVFALTHKCNQRCIFCSNDNFRSYPKLPGLMTTKEVCRYIVENFQSFSDRITLTGGEPTLRNDLLDILEFINLKFPRAKITLLTNGQRFIYKNYAHRLKKIRGLEVEIPLLGPTKKIHDTLTNSSGYVNSIKGIQNLIDEDIEVGIRLLILKENHNLLADIVETIFSELNGTKKIIFINPRITGQALKNSQYVGIRYSDTLPFIYKAIEKINLNIYKLELLHFPLCILKKKYWIFTINNPYKELFGACKQCRLVKRCPGFLKSYINIYGKEEIVPII